MRTIRLVFESFIFAAQALKANLLRTILSLLGVTIGIFAIIAVLTLVDSLEKNIRDSMSFLGDKVLYVQKWPWSFGEDYPWWKYLNRPVSSQADFRFLERNLQGHSAVAIFASRGNRTLRNGNNSVSNAALMGISFEYNYVSDVPLSQGRYFTPQEIETGKKFMIIGHTIAESLFPMLNPIGQTISVKGRKFTIIGVMERQGDNLLGTPSNDNNCMIPYGAFAQMFTIGRYGVEPIIAIKGHEYDKDLMDLEGEVRGLMRSKRGLKPTNDDNFAINRPEMVAGAITAIFSVLEIAGAFIGGLSILVGGFGIANIMFVSVKERTNLIGIQKSLGAKNYFILSQFLFEAVFLSLIGGLAGLFLVFLITIIPQDAMDIGMSAQNVALGLGISSVIGVLAGIIPAYLASRLDPVEAIRSK
jgi:putative ABC transport system permease protein